MSTFQTAPCKLFWVDGGTKIKISGVSMHTDGFPIESLWEFNGTAVMIWTIEASKLPQNINLGVKLRCPDTTLPNSLFLSFVRHDTYTLKLAMEEDKNLVSQKEKSWFNQELRRLLASFAKRCTKEQWLAVKDQKS